MLRQNNKDFRHLGRNFIIVLMKKDWKELPLTNSNIL
jgi:hypothetical protein